MRDYTFPYRKHRALREKPKKKPMANKHCKVKNGKVGRGVKHANYILGQDKFAVKGKEQVVFSASENMPSFAVDNPMDFWKSADEFERANGRVYKEIEFSIPREITDRTEQIQFASEFVKATIGQNHPVTFAIHNAKAEDGQPNLHCHAMFSTRENDGIERSAEQYFKRAAAPYRHRVTKQMVEADPSKGGAKKTREMDSKEFVQDVRSTYEAQVQKTLLAHGHADLAKSFSMKSNQARGLGEAEPRIGPVHARSQLNHGRDILKATVEVIREIRSVVAERAKKPKPLSRYHPHHPQQIEARKAEAEALLKASSVPLIPAQRTEEQKPEIQERTETRLDAFLDTKTYKSTSGQEYSIIGLAKEGSSIYGTVVGSVKLQEGDYTIIHKGRLLVELVKGIVAEIGAKVEGVVREGRLALNKSPEKDRGLGR